MMGERQRNPTPTAGDLKKDLWKLQFSKAWRWVAEMFKAASMVT